MGNAAVKLDTSQPYAAELIELNDVEKQLAELRAKHGTVPDYTSKEGYACGKASIKELTSYRTGTDKARLAITKPHREFIDQVNQYAKSLIAEIEKLEAPHRDAKQEVDEAEKRKKEERIARLREKLHKEVTSYLDTAMGLDSAGLVELIDAAEAIDTENYFDVTKEAEDEKARVLRELRDQHSRAQERERLAAERAELERQKAELERLKAQQAPAEPTAGDVATAGGTDFSQEDSDDWEGMGSALQDVPSADPFGDALEDLQCLGLDPSQAVDVLSAIQRGDVRHIAFHR
ncbi:hypothetical protein [Halomonas sp. RT37]|uniref:Uncharacterized protein n=1 Tax=Halomonas sp. RT37 TaxID=2950872 RepID=A0AAU7KCU1_9GAMM